jgi:hypothetical protein
MSADHETTLRRGKTAATWAKKAAGSFAYMIENAQSDGQRNALGYFASRLLDAILDEAETLAGVVPSEYTEEALRSAEAVVKRLKQRRLAERSWHDGNCGYQNLRSGHEEDRSLQQGWVTRGCYDC